MSDPLEPLRRLEVALRKEMQALGFEVVEFLVAPDGHVTAMFAPMPSPPAPQGDDPEFEAIIEAERKRELETRAEREREELIELREHLRDPRKGFLD